MTTSKYVYWIRDVSNDGFNPESSWKMEQIKKGLICGSCSAIFPATARDIRQVAVENTLPVKLHKGTLQDTTDGCILSQPMMDAIGRSALSAIGTIIPIISCNGGSYGFYECVIGNLPKTGLARGVDPTYATICRVCGNFSYWPGWPPKKWYLLNEYWKEEPTCLFVGGWLFVSKETYEDRIQPLRFAKVFGSKVKLLDRPTDGLPADVEELRAELRRNNAFNDASGEQEGT